MHNNLIFGFSKLTEQEKRGFIASLCNDPASAGDKMKSFLMQEYNQHLFQPEVQHRVSHFYLMLLYEDRD